MKRELGAGFKKLMEAAADLGPADGDLLGTMNINKPPLLLAHKYKNQDPTGWWMSEKLDGVRAYWDGENFISRLGNVFHAPEWFRHGIPNVELDGELWCGRKKFSQTISTVKKHVPIDTEWEHIIYVVFDMPQTSGSFETRMDAIKNITYNEDVKMLEFWNNETVPHSSVYSLQHIKCKSAKHLAKFLKEIESCGGEGVMLREPNSFYESGRSNTLLKIKTFFDEEAIVIGYEPGKGKHVGRVGSLLVEDLKTKTKFSVGTGLNDLERETPPGIGEIITYRFQELTKDGIPRFPSFVANRNYE